MEYKKKLKRIKKSIKPVRTQRAKKMPNERGESICFCQDTKGEYKELYLTQDKAIEQAQEVWRYQGIKLKSYPCPDTLGWHLSRY